MARIPTLDGPQVQQRGLGAPTVGGQGPDNSGLQRGLAQIGQAAQQYAARESEKADTAALMAADQQLEQWQQNTFFDPEAGVYTKKGSAALDITNQTIGQFEQQQAKIGESLKNERQRARYNELVMRRRQSLSGDLNRYEFSERERYYDDVERGQVETAMQGAALNYNDPEKIGYYQSKMAAVLESQAQRKGLPAEMQQATMLKANSGMASAVISRMVDDDPYKAKSYFQTAQEGMTAEDQVRIGGMIDNKIERLQQKAEMAQLRAEARAERAIGKINAQIASGIPATDEMWRQWGNQVRGTPAQGEFDQLVQQEAETQKVLGMPIDQQIAFVNQKAAQIQQNGGTMADAANINRLKRAVESSAKMLNDAPVEYLQQRLGGSVEPVDLSSPDLGAVLSDRIASIQGMQQKFGSTVPMKPLLPQEAKQLSAQLDQMSPEQQSQTFATLHLAMGDDKAYAGAMQQIAPDSPVRALTGLLAGKQRTMTTNSRWFRPDDIVTSGDVAKTMALGESILNRSKTEKGSDGKAAAFPMPKQADFQLALNTQLGSVFAGQPQSYLLAYQAVKAYYAGAAAQRGDVSGDVDSGLLRQAIKASVGEVVDFNGGETLAPWGMPGDTFREMAAERLEGTMRDQGMSDEDIAASSALTLRQYRDGVYYVMQGQQFKYGADGKPLMINVNEGEK